MLDLISCSEPSKAGGEHGEDLTGRFDQRRLSGSPMTYTVREMAARHRFSEDRDAWVVESVTFLIRPSIV